MAVYKKIPCLDGMVDQMNVMKVISSASAGDAERKIGIEKVLLENGQQMIRILTKQGAEEVAFSLLMSEAELLELLHQAVHADVLPKNIVALLREKIEI